MSDVLSSAAVEQLQQWGGSPRLSLGSFHLTRNHPAKESGGKFVWSKGPRDFWKLHLVYTGVITPPSDMVAEDSGCGQMRLPQLKCQNPSSKTRWKKAELRSPTQWGWVQDTVRTFCKVLPTSGAAPVLQEFQSTHCKCWTLTRSGFRLEYQCERYEIIHISLIITYTTREDKAVLCY